MTDFLTDPRYPFCSDSGKAELEVYLQWIADASLKDSEYAFIEYVKGRAGIQDGRHLLAIWEYQMQGQFDKTARSQMRLFFVNPNPEAAFDSSGAAGWFDFIESVYVLKSEVAAPLVRPPVFAKVGTAELPAQDFEMA
jgi:hypothetical protein